MTRHDLYGFGSTSVEDAGAILAGATGLAFGLHDSDYLGGAYFRAVGPDGEEVTVQDNVADEDGVLAEPEFPEHRTLVYVAGARRPLAVDGLTLLRSDELPST